MPITTGILKKLFIDCLFIISFYLSAEPTETVATPLLFGYRNVRLLKSAAIIPVCTLKNLLKYAILNAIT